MKFISFLMAAALVCALAACSSPKSEAPEKHCPVVGEVKALDDKNQTVTIQHQAICDWMEAMTMEFPVQSKDEFSQLHVGDKIMATVNIKGMDYSLNAIHKQPPPK